MSASHQTYSLSGEPLSTLSGTSSTSEEVYQ